MFSICSDYSLIPFPHFCHEERISIECIDLWLWAVYAFWHRLIIVSQASPVQRDLKERHPFCFKIIYMKLLYIHYICERQMFNFLYVSASSLLAVYLIYYLLICNYKQNINKYKGLLHCLSIIKNNSKMEQQERKAKTISSMGAIVFSYRL